MRLVVDAKNSRAGIRSDYDSVEKVDAMAKVRPTTWNIRVNLSHGDTEFDRFASMMKASDQAQANIDHERRDF